MKKDLLMILYEAQGEILRKMAMGDKEVLEDFAKWKQNNKAIPTGLSGWKEMNNPKAIDDISKQHP